MNSLEDAYVSIAKAEERLHYGDSDMIENDDLQSNAEFIRYLDLKGNPSFFQQIGAVFIRRML